MEEWRYPKNCIVCNKVFMPKVPTQICCCAVCSEKRNSRLSTIRNQQYKKDCRHESKEIKTKRGYTITDIQKMEQKEGLSYGKFVEKYGV